MTATDAAGAVAQVQTLRVSRTEVIKQDRAVPIEAPVAIEINGLGYAVMMATPSDLTDFGVGFLICEGIIASADEVMDSEAVAVDQGWLLRLTISEARAAPIFERVRHRVAESGCGLCGVENIEQALRPLPQASRPRRVSPDAIFAALTALEQHQPLNAASGAAHAAAMCSTDGQILLAREDVGRHCALDKLVGAAARTRISLANGFVLLSSRCSYELVEKSVRAGVSILATISAPTSLAAERSTACGLTLIALARRDNVLVLNDPQDLFGGCPPA